MQTLRSQVAILSGLGAGGVPVSQQVAKEGENIRTGVTLAKVGQELRLVAVRVVREVQDACAQHERR